MHPSASPESQLGPLNPGDVVSAALKLYRDRFKTFFQIALQATAWLIAGVIGFVLVVAILAGLLGVIGGEVMAIVGGLLGLVVGLVPLLYGSAKYYMLASLIGRLSFRYLINQPETALEAKQQVAPKLGQFLFISMLLLLAYLAAYLVATLVALLLGGGLGFVISGLLGALINPAIGGIFGVFLGVLVGAALFIFALIWIASRLFIAEVVLAIESDQDAGGSLSRSWELTQASVWRIQIVFLATFLIQLPILSVTNYIPSILLELLPGETLAYAVTVFLSVVLSLLGSMVILPFWQAVKGVLYYDLRSRREGLDLELRHRPEDLA